jgi:NDP-sugar pyrophosphorylase family protein
VKTAPAADAQVVVPAGGLATRMKGILGEIPKVLTPVGGRPFLAYLLRRCVSQGFSRVHLCLGVGHEQVARYLEEDGSGAEVSYTVEDKPAGVIGAIVQAKEWLAPQVIVVLGDVFPRCDIASLHARAKQTGRTWMSVCPGSAALEPGNSSLGEDGRVIEYVRLRVPPRPYLHTGVTVLQRAMLDEPWVAAAPDEGSFYQRLMEQGALYARAHREANPHVGDPTAFDHYAPWLESIWGSLAKLPGDEWITP